MMWKINNFHKLPSVIINISEKRGFMSRIIPFPVQKKTVIIKEFDYFKFQNELNSFQNQGYEIIRTSSLFKKTGFGGITGFFAELQLSRTNSQQND